MLIRFIIAGVLVLAAGGCSHSAPVPTAAAEQTPAPTLFPASEATESVLPAVSATKPRDALPDAAYLAWKAQLQAMIGDKPYTLPAYNPEVGPLQLVYSVSPAGYSLDLYRSRTGYETGTELTGLHTSYDLYYSYSRQEGKGALSDAERISLFGKQDQVQEGNIQIYGLETVKGADGWKEGILDLLEQKDIDSARIILLKLENQTNVNLYIAAGNYRVSLFFAAQGPDELKEYLNHSLVL